MTIPNSEAMKTLIKILSAFGLGALLLASCKEEPAPLVNTPAVNVTTEKLDPNANESGTVRAFPGTQVTAKGINLDKVGGVRVDGVPAEIVTSEMKTLVFKIPASDKQQTEE